MNGLTAAIERFLEEDLGRGDRTTEALIPPGLRGAACIRTREDVVVAGLDQARACFELLSRPDLQWSSLVTDGSAVGSETCLAEIQATMRAILSAERTALNLLSRLSGIATITAKFVEAVADTPAEILDTRKTAPGLRELEKYAVRIGGGRNHRFGLDDGILIKDNHIAAVDGVEEAVVLARRNVSHGLRIQVEVESLDQLDQALSAGADAILLDNMSPQGVAEAVARAGGKVMLEASGGITLDNVRSYALTGVDFISVGALTSSPQSIDMTLDVVG